MKYISYSIGIFVFSLGVGMLIHSFIVVEDEKWWELILNLFSSVYLMGSGLWFLDVPTITIINLNTNR